MLAFHVFKMTILEDVADCSSRLRKKGSFVFLRLEKCLRVRVSFLALLFGCLGNPDLRTTELPRKLWRSQLVDHPTQLVFIWIFIC